MPSGGPHQAKRLRPWWSMHPMQRTGGVPGRGIGDAVAAGMAHSLAPRSRPPLLWLRSGRWMHELLRSLQWQLDASGSADPGQSETLPTSGGYVPLSTAWCRGPCWRDRHGREQDLGHPSLPRRRSRQVGWEQVLPLPVLIALCTSLGVLGASRPGRQPGPQGLPRK